jgi:hypothetical protein
MTINRCPQCGYCPTCGRGNQYGFAPGGPMMGQVPTINPFLTSGYAYTTSINSGGAAVKNECNHPGEFNANPTSI